MNDFYNEILLIQAINCFTFIFGQVALNSQRGIVIYSIVL
jgi:hypothetical protein